MTGPLHPDQIPTSRELVRALLAAQFPQWADLPIRPVASAGTDHAIYRLGEDLCARLPLRASAADQAGKEQAWLPSLAPRLPAPIPQPVAVGAPGDDYPWPWSICAWIEGGNPVDGDSLALAEDLAAFVGAMRKVDPTGGPAPGRHNFGRGVPLAMRDVATRDAIARCEGLVDTRGASRAWSDALAAPSWEGPPVWVHGDLCPGNLLVRDGRLAAVIDFGGLAVGDPACDLMVGWNLLSPAARERFRLRLRADPASWARGRGWALSVALIQLPYYRETNPSLAANARATIAAVLADI